jgi:hypothetical protein
MLIYAVPALDFNHSSAQFELLKSLVRVAPIRKDRGGHLFVPMNRPWLAWPRSVVCSKSAVVCPIFEAGAAKR